MGKNMKREELAKHIAEDIKNFTLALDRGKFEYVANEILDLIDGFGCLKIEEEK